MCVGMVLIDSGNAIGFVLNPKIFIFKYQIRLHFFGISTKHIFVKRNKYFAMKTKAKSYIIEYCEHCG